MNRLETLLEFYVSEPNNSFNLYALALEYIKTDKELARLYFEKLLNQHPSYLPTYYHVADLYVSLELVELAIHAYKKGISLAIEQQNTRTLDELKRAYRTFLEEEEWL